jgi:ABC-type dipeptide/oligopeptide/nickel transport system permease component
VLAYTVKRLIQGIVTVWFIATATFIAMHSVPGDPLANQKATTEQIQRNLRERYGLDRPVTEQYVVFLGNMLRGDFGISFTQENRRVNDIIRESFPVSATLGILAVAFAAFGGVLWGALTASPQPLPDSLVPGSSASGAELRGGGAEPGFCAELLGRSPCRWRGGAPLAPSCRHCARLGTRPI